jgi:hypothetical protein
MIRQKLTARQKKSSLKIKNLLIQKGFLFKYEQSIK